MKALVTGATGFIGSHLVETLLKHNWDVRCLVRQKGPYSWLAELPVEYVQGDCRKREPLAEAVRGVDAVFHLAGVTKAVDRRTYFEVNAQGTDNLLHACERNNPRLRRFIYVSSLAAAGPGGTPRTEEDPCEPVSDYGRSKLAGEAFVLRRSSTIPITIIRPPIVYGPRDRALPPLFRLFNMGISPCLTGERQRFSFCYIDDLISGILLAFQKEKACGEIFFLDDGIHYSWDEIKDVILKVTAGRQTLSIPVPKFFIRGTACLCDVFAFIRRQPTFFNRDKAQEMIQPGWLCDNSKAKRMLDFEPRFALFTGIQKTYEWYKKVKWL